MLREQYQVRVYPTVLLLDSNGKEIDRLCGWSNDKNSYFAQLVDYSNHKNTVADLLARLNLDSLNAHWQYEMAKKYTGRYELDKAKRYFEKVLRLDPRDKLGYGQESRGYLATQHLYETGDDRPLQMLLAEATNKEHISRGYQILIRFYKSQKNSQNVVDAYEKVLQKLDENSNLMNGYSWYVYENKIEDRYTNAISYTRKAVSLQPHSAHIWDTLAWLEFETGQLDSAVEHMRIAAELEPGEEYFRTNLDRFLQADK